MSSDEFPILSAINLSRPENSQIIVFPSGSGAAATTGPKMVLQWTTLDLVKFASNEMVLPDRVTEAPLWGHSPEFYPLFVGHDFPRQ